MSEITITCKNCGQCVPKTRFCGECGAPLAIINQPTSKQDKISTPVQVVDSVSFDINKSTSDKRSTPPTTTQSRTDGLSKPEVSGTPSYAETTRSNVSEEEKGNDQQNNQTNNTGGPAGPASSSENSNMTVHLLRNDGTAVIIDNGASKSDVKDFTDLATANNEIQVVFHMLIPISVWNWNEHCNLTIRFVNSTQPKIHEVSPNCSRCRWPKIDAYEIIAFVYLPVSYLNKKIPYKYVIYSGHSNGMWEYIHDLPERGTFNRCLELSQSSSNQKLFHVYDGFVFPNEHWWSRISSYFSDTGISTKDSHGYALRVFLQMVNLSISGFDILRTVDTVYNVYLQLKQKKYLLYTDPRRHTVFCCTDQLDRGLHQWILETIQCVGEHQNTDKHIRMWSAKVVMALVTIIRLTGIKYSHDNNITQVMLSYLYLEKDLCKYVVDQMDESVRTKVALSIAQICSVSMEFTKKGGEPYWEWLYVVPLLHQLQLQDGVTHDYMTVDPSKPNWGTQGLDRSKLKEFSERIQSKKIMGKLFLECKNHIKDDHLLLRLLVFLSSEDDIDVMLGNAPVHIVALHAADLWHTIDKIKKAEKKVEVMVRIIDCITNSADGNSHWYFCTLVAAKCILDKMRKICSNTQGNMNVLYFSLKLYLYALSYYTSGIGGDEARYMITSYINDVQVYLLGWLHNPDVNFGDYFGGKGGSKIKDEIKLWNDILMMPAPFELSSEIIQEWETKMQQIIINRTENLQEEVFIKIAVEICNSKEPINQTLSNFMWKSITELMENESIIKGTQQLMDTKKDKANTGTLFSTLLSFYCSKREINLTTLLTFPLWPEYLKHFASHDYLAQHFTDGCIKICTEALNVLSDVAEKLKQGKVKVQELELLTSHMTQAVNLFSPKVVEKATNDPSFNIRKIITQRNSEVQRFQSYCSTVRILLEHCESIAQGNIVEFMQEGLQRIDTPEEYAELEVCQLYEVINGEEVYAILTITDSNVMEMLKPFAVMMEEYKTVVSQKIWRCHVQKHSVLPLPEVATAIWSPVFAEIQQLIQKCNDKSITLKETDYYFKGVLSQNLKEEIQKLVEGCNLCLDETLSTTWISQFVISVNYYRDGCKAQVAAQLILTAKDALMLKGNFKELEKFKSKVFIQSDMTLKEFDKVEGCEIDSLKDIANSERQMQFLEVLSNSQQFIAWLQKETKDVTELHNLVGLSMFENDKRTVDRIAKLHTVGSTIAPLVYELKRDSGLLEFLEKCEPVWKALVKDPKFSDLFEFCHRDLEFLKQIKDMQAPIEVSTYDQVKAILIFGVYNISCKYHQIFCSSKEIVSLRIKNCSYSEQKQIKYTLDDLKDLESKIILIRDSRSSTVNGRSLETQLSEDLEKPGYNVSVSSDASVFEKLSSKEVDEFLDKFHMIVHITDTLLHLQQAGHPQYVEWSKSFTCNTVTQNELQNLNEQMKRDLQNWLNEVSSLRTKLYALNYFTCLQLLRISSEFYCLINNPNHEISNEIFMLLMSLSPDLTVEKIKEITSTAEAQEIVLRSLPTFTPTDHNESHCIMDEVDVPEEIKKLNEAEKEIYFKSVQDYDFSPRMVIAAIHQCGSSEDEVLEWCFNPQNASMFESKPVVSEDSIKLAILEVDVDVTNATVQELIELEFSESLAIEAVQKCGEDLSECLEYCSNETLARSTIFDDDTHEEIPDNILLDGNESETKDASLFDLSSPEYLPVTRQKTPEKPNFINLEGTGMLLNTLAKALSKNPITRPFIKCFEKGTPNFLSVPPCDIFKTVVSIYAQGNYKLFPLPTLEEVLICDHNTTVEEISLLWYRAIRDPDRKQIFCLVNGEKLPYQVCVEAFEKMDKILTGETDYRLVIVCSNENKEERSYIMEHLQMSHRDASAVMAKDEVIHDFLKHHMSHNVQYGQQIFASEADIDKCAVRIIRSRRTGMGKSLYVKRMTETLEKKFKTPVTFPLCVTIPIHGPNVVFDKVMKSLLCHANPMDPLPQIFHFDVAPSILDAVDALLFSILILKGLKDSSSNVWRCFPQQLYLVEATYNVLKQDIEAGGTQNCNTIEFLKFIPTITCYGPKDAISHVPHKKNAFYCDANEILSVQYQRPYQYLVRLSNPTSVLDTYTFVKSDISNDVGKFLNVVLRYFDDCGVTDPSWTDLRHFLWFLNAQLEDCESSVFCKASYIADTLPGFKTFVVQFMLKMSKDFAVPSLRIAVRSVGIINIGLLHQSSPQHKASDATPVNLSAVSNTTPIKSSPTDQTKFFTSTPVKSTASNILPVELNLSEKNIDTCPSNESSARNNLSSIETSATENADILTVDTVIIEQYQILPDRVWEYSFHPYIFFNKDHTSMTFIGFCANNNGDLIDPASRKVIHERLFTRELLRGLKMQQVTFTDDGSNNQEELLLKLLMVMGINLEILYRYPDSSYVLTADNTKKILAILMRFRCDIPVVLMGETGCGKTRLIKYMCDLLSLNSDNETLLIMKVHGGVTEQDIVEEVTKARELARKNARDGLDTVMFFDEANTTEAIGLIKEIMCDKRIRGEPIKENIKFIAACNPYRKHSSEMIDKLEKAGLGYYINSVNTKQKLGNIPLRNLVYRVLELPSSMQSLVYDFGQLSYDTEKDYATKIVGRYVGKIPNLDIHKGAVTDVLMACQNYMRDKKDECSFVSLRDIERAMIVLEWFHSVIQHIESDDLYKYTTCDRHTRALVLTIAVCYYTKLQYREDFEKYIAPLLMRNAPDAPKIFKEEIRRCQEVFLNNMKLPQNIARNNALRENVFMMVICIELKIPLFLVGKPGSSKSLAKSIVADSMLGAVLSKPLFQRFKQVQVFSYQCSQHSTSETILEVFHNATKFQEEKKGQQYVSVVVLDEVGLAEDSPSLPLKTLHPLLEDGTTGSRDIADRVAFIGISNWALDPAKMNRGIMVTRDDPGQDELAFSARGICSSSGEVCKRLECFFIPFAEAYLEICQEQMGHGKEFFGLRDFYSLIKMMYWISEKSGETLTMNQLQHCLMRNFGGKIDVNKTVELFLRKVRADLLHAKSSTSDIENYDCTLYGLIKSSLQAKCTSWHGENRYLLFLTENYSALRILQQTDLIGHDPLILFGSSFPQDINYTQVCRNINQIKFCMDTGRTVILLNLEHLYASLYDLLNQYYITLGDTRYVDLGLQSHRIKCRVHPNFKLVLIADKDKVYDEFPTPLINRLEKHYLITSTMLSKKQEKLMKKIEDWVKNFSKLSITVIGTGTFTPEDAFVGYQSDTPASVVFKVWQDLELSNVELDEDSEQWEEEAFLKSQEFLFKMATPDAVARSKHSELFTKWAEIHEVYFKIHSYFYLDDFLSKQVNSDKGILMQITTHAPLLQYRNISLLYKSLGFTKKDQIVLLTLQQFDTEIDFCTRIRSVFQREPVDDCLLIVQCESGHEYIDLIACARYRVLDEKTQASQFTKVITHVVFIISLPRRRGGTKFVGFQGGAWECYHMDSLLPPKDSLLTIKCALNTPINDILLECYTNKTELLHKRLPNWISLSLLHSNNVQIEQAVLDRFNLLSQLIKEAQISTDAHNQNVEQSLHKQTYQYQFCEILLRHVFKSLKTKKDIESRPHKQEWASREALNAEALHKSGSYINLLLLKLDSVVAGTLSKILSAVDRYCNLHLLQSKSHAISLLWLKIFEDAEIILDLTNGLENTGFNHNNAAVFASFKCDFPFFWLLINSIESHWKISAINDSKSFDVYNIFKSNSIANKLTVVIGDDIEEVFKCYVHDFVMYSSGSSEYNQDTKIIEQILYNEQKRMTQDNLDIDNVLLYQIISLHEAYHRIEPQLRHLKQITMFGTNVSNRLQAYFTLKETDMGIDLYAVQELLVMLQPCFKKWSADDCRQWLRAIHNYQNTIDATIFAAIENQGSSATSKKIRRDWHLLRVLQIFVEHTNEYVFSVTMKIAMRMHKFLEKDHDFSKLLVYERLKKTIVAYAGDPQINLQLNIRQKARDSCSTLFLEIVSEIIFAVSSSTFDEPPEDELVFELIKSVIPSTGSTQQLSPLTDSKADEIPVVRSYLLQLLLDYDVNKIRAHLNSYFQNSCTMMQQDVNFLVLCTQCFEDALHKKASNSSLLNAVQLAVDSLDQAMQHIFANSANFRTLEYVESVAKFRYTLETVAWLLHEYYLDPVQFNVLSRDEKNLVAKLISSVQKMCLAIDKDDTEVVANLLIKCIVRKYGMSTLIALCDKSEELNFLWLIPKHLQLQKDTEGNQEDKTVDTFVIYGKQYADIRNNLVTTREENSVANFKTLNLKTDNSGQLLLALYSIVTKSHSTDSRFNHQVLSDLENHIHSSCFEHSAELANVTSHLMYNFQACSCPLLTVNSQRSLRDQQLCAVIVHTVIVIMCTKNNLLLTPLQHFVQSSSQVKSMFFPTMPHDELFETAAVSRVGRIYKCKNGHPFAVTECGRPMQLATCHECGEPIGGQSHKLTKGNVEYQGEDTTQTGHLLGPAQHLSKQATPERDLSPVACTIIRLIMHAALVWGTACVTEGPSVISSITHPVVKTEDLPQFLWQHLTRDIDLLSKVIGRSLDDAALLIHLILQGMYNSTYSETKFDLLTKESRKQWEQQFCELYVRPILNDMDTRLTAAQNLFINDDRQAHNALLQVVYEKNTEKSLTAAMWRYRSRITIEHLEFFIEQQKSTVKCPLLKKYLKEEVKLRVTQYLPDIIQLQYILYKLYNYKVDEEEVSKLTIKDLQENRDSDTLRALIDSFHKAWLAVKSFLPSYGRRRVSKELVVEVSNNPQEIPLVYLIPTKTGKGVCSTALVDFLVTTHNEFINFYHSTVKIKAKEPLSLRDLQSCHLVAGKQQFMSIVMSHCHYSLTRGKGTEVHYDIAALERHFLSRFVHGRPLFDPSSAPTVVHCRNIHSSENFAAIRKNIRPQKPITLEAKKAIIKELNDSNKLREILEMVNTMLAILASTTTIDDAFRTIGQYTEELFKQKLTPKVKNCTLSNVISLWETLAVEQARRAVLANQDLFKDVGDDFKEQIIFSQADETQFYVSLKKFHTDQLLGSLYQFIILFVRNCSVYSKDWLLVDTFPEFLEQEQMDVPGLGTKFRGLMPKSIMLSHVVDIWKKIVMYEARAADK